MKNDDRFTEILQKLTAQYNNGETVDPNGKEYAQFQCDVYNETTGNRHEYDGYNCPHCKNKGYIHIVRENPFSGAFVTAQRDCKCMKMRDTINRAKRSGLGNILIDYKFDKYETPEEWQQTLKAAAQKFCTDEGATWFYIGGQTGAGKTHLCTAIAAHYIKAGYDCAYMLWVDDAIKLKSVKNDFEKYQPMINRFKNVDVLYIDDFLKTQDGTTPTFADVQLAFELLNSRMTDSSKTTVISSELTLPRLLEIDEATAGRIYQLTGDYKLNIGKDMNKNYRLKQ